MEDAPDPNIEVKVTRNMTPESVHELRWGPGLRGRPYTLAGNWALQGYSVEELEPQPTEDQTVEKLRASGLRSFRLTRAITEPTDLQQQ